MYSIVELIFVPLVLLACTTHTVLAEIKSPPYFVKEPTRKEILFYVDRSFEIPCEAKGIPSPDYIWTKNGKIFNWTNEGDRISQEAGKGTLIINTPESSDAGQYQCYAENNWGTATSISIFARRIELHSFRNEPTMRKEAIEGQPFSLACEPPYGYPTPHVNWMLQDSLGKPNSITSPRITADPTGTLWFSNITEKDAIDDHLYACFATSSHISEMKIGPKVILEVVQPEPSLSSDGDQNTKGVPPVRQYTSKNEEISLNNTKVRLYCIFGGTPLPTITWYKNEQLMTFSNKISLKENGKIVVIKKSRPSDEGNYTCEANNGIGDALSHTISLKIFVEPEFVQKPESATLDEEEAIEFHCQASGNPAPEIIWTHNGLPISEATPNPRRIVSANSIVIEKLWKNDTGNYGCNATNSVGYVYQDVYVNVLAEPPNIVEISENKEILQGNTVTLKCRAQGSPKPQIIWLKNDIEVTGERFTTTKNGDLTINKIEVPDMGNYICLAKNKFSLINTTVNLDVRQRTRITPGNGPSNSIVMTGESATFRCSPQADPSLDRNITWLHNGQSIDFSLENFTRGNDGSLIIKHATESQAGIYSCFVSTRLDNATAEASLSIQRVPYPPESLMLSCENTSTANLIWVDVKPINPHIIAPVDHHVIQYSTSLLPDTWETLDNFKVSQNISQFQAKVQMKPWSNYTFRTLSVNEFGLSMPSKQSGVCSSPPDIPYENPYNVSVQVIDDTTLLISWQLMSRTEHNAPGFYYNISWKLDSSEKEWHSEIIPEWDHGQYKIHNLLPNHKYLITVGAGNDQGQARSEPELIERVTPPDVPHKNPENVTVQAINPTTLSISWKAMPEIEQNGPGFYYNVSWKWGTSKEKWHNQIISEWQTKEYQIHNLLPYHKYTVTIGAGNNRGPARFDAEPLEYTTPSDLPMKNPNNVTTQVINSTTIMIFWEPMPEAEHNGPGFYYNISWKLSSTEDEWHSRIIPEWETNEYHIYNLLPNHKYFVTIGAGNDQGLARSDLEHVECTTPPDIPYKNPDNVTVQATTPTTLTISWKPMPEIEHNGPGFYYNLSWKRDTTEVDWQHHIIPDWQTREYQVPDAAPYETYLITVFAGNNLGQPEYSPGEPTECKTPPDIPYKNPINITVQASAPTVLQISWEPMPKTEHNGPGFYYSVSWKIDSPETDWKNISITEWERGEYKVFNTLPYEEHLVKVISGNDLGESMQPPIIVKGYYEQEVPLEAPKNLKLLKIISSTSAEISWNRVPLAALRGNFQKYEIEIWSENDQQKRGILKESIEYDLDRTIINHMIPNIKNKVRMSVFNEKHQGPFSAELEIDMSEAVSNLVQSLEAKPLGSSALSLFWKPPLKTNGNLTGYEIHYQEVSGTELGVLREHVPQISDPNQIQAKLLDLEPDTNYKIDITAITNTGNGETFSIEQKTPSQSSNLIQPDFQIVPTALENTTIFSVKIIWLPCGTNKEDTNNCNDQSIGSEFRVDYRLKGDRDFKEVSERVKNNVIINNLLPNKDYEFIVSSIDGRLATKSAMKPFKIDAPTEAETQVPSEATIEELFTQPSSTKNNTTDLTMKPIDETTNESVTGWVIVFLAILFLVVLLILIAVYLKNLTKVGKYIVEDKEIQNGRPDKIEDTDTTETSPV